MAGILDSKKRILDFIITDEGRNQAAQGELRIRYATFSDASAFYVEKSGSIADDISKNIFFEVSSKPQDSVVLETQPVTFPKAFNTGLNIPSDLQSGRPIKPFKTEDFSVNGEAIMARDQLINDNLEITELIGSEISEIPDKLCSSITKNFKNIQSIGSYDPFDATSGFEIGPKEHTFKFQYWSPNTIYPDGNRRVEERTLTSLESIYQDKRFTHMPNFKFLPPVNKALGSTKQKTLLGKYKNFTQSPLTYRELISRLEENENSYAEINFDKTSKDNNILIQAMEFSKRGSSGSKQLIVKKLAMLDFGQFFDTEDNLPKSRVFFVGKLYTDENNESTYVNLFTVIME